MEINIIGAGLNGCLSAFKIKKKFPHYIINLIESSDHVISAFDPIKIGEGLYNNGFHGIELPRSKNLSDFFESSLNINLVEKKNIKKLLISGELVDYMSPLSEYPQSIKNYYKKVPTKPLEKFEEFYDCISDEFESILKIISTRYSDKIHDVQHLLLPWFFPIEYDILSNDEGDKFRTKVRSGKIVSTYRWPEGMLLSKIQKPFHASLKSIGVNIYLNSKVFFEDFGATVSNSNFVGKSTKTLSKDDIVISCITPIGLLKKISLDSYNDLTKSSKVMINAIIKVKSKSIQTFTEILCADTQFYQLSRISKPLLEEDKKDKDKNKEYFQLEIITENNWNKDYFLKKINDFFSKTMKIYGYELEEIIDIKETRKVFFPSKNSLELAQNHIEIWSKKFPNYKTLKAFGPMNMSKTWLYSDEVVNFISKI
jgi:hypothetical protein